MKHSDVIKSINYKIENSNFEKFPLDQVINELNNTYRDLASKTDIFETRDFLKLEGDQLEYALPKGMARPTRAIYRGQKIDFVSQEAMDLNIPGWEATTVEEPAIEFLVYNNLGVNWIRPYPHTNWAGVAQPSGDLQYLGALTDVSTDLQNYVWLRTEDGAKYFSDALGAISDLNLVEVVTIYGTYLPPQVVEIALEAEMADLDDLYVNALIYGTAGNLLFTSGRTEDAAKGQNFLRLYGIDETDVAMIRKRDFTGGFRNTARNQQYRTPFDK